MGFSKLSRAARDAYQAESEARPGEKADEHQARSMRLTEDLKRQAADATPAAEE